MTRRAPPPPALLLLAAGLTAAAVGCTSEGGGGGGAKKVGVPDPSQATYAPALNVQLPAMYKTPGGVFYQDSVVGTGQVAIPGARIEAHYTGWLPDGSKFDSSRDRGQPIPFTLGEGMVIRGWDEGIQGMKVGGHRKLVIPAALAYGADSPGPDIPANATLVFNVELVRVQ